MAPFATEADDVAIRVATCDDAAALAGFAERSFRETFGRDNTRSDMEQYVASAFGEEKQRDELAEARRVVLLAEIDGVIAGYAQLLNDSVPRGMSLQSPVAELERFYVAPEWHGRGIAQRLMSRATELLAAQNTVTFWLAVWERNPRAIAYYRKSGFVDAGSKIFVLGSDRQTDRVMIRRLLS